ncbi:patatin-like phospholipase family protein [Oleomonas cavernae]|nr:patatin-like phospholipase family protein [Oleomonas cavernae]
MTQLRAYVAFEGGGAKGLVHIGALKFLETKNVLFKGFAGTSAGAIIAALKAAGYAADDLVDPIAKTTLLDDQPVQMRDALDLLGRWNWRKIQAIVFAASKIPYFPRLYLVATLLSFGALFNAMFEDNRIGMVLFAAIFALLLFVLSRVILGVATLDHFRDHFAELLRLRIAPASPDHIVCFRDFGPKTGRPDLMIVATNITGGRMTLFSADTTPNVPVADAVAASICIPAIFRPWKIEGQHYYDGGLVSNLPAWPFDEMRAIDPDAYTFAIEIEGNDRSLDADADGFQWIRQILRTAVFGSSFLSKRAIGRLEVVKMRTETGLLEFDLRRDAVMKLVADATAFAAADIGTNLFANPAILHEACGRLRDAAIQVFRDTVEVFAAGAFVGRVRVAVAMLEDGYTRSLRLRHGVGFETDTDEALLLPIDGSFVGEAWNKKERYFTVMPDGWAEAPEWPIGSLEGPENRQLRKLIWPNLMWSLSVPILGGDGKVQFVAVLDGNDRIGPTSAKLEAVIDLISDHAKTIFKTAVEKLIVLA